MSRSNSASLQVETLAERKRQVLSAAAIASRPHQNYRHEEHDWHPARPRTIQLALWLSHLPPCHLFSSVLQLTHFIALAKAAPASRTSKCSSSVSICWADGVTHHAILGMRELCTCNLDSLILLGCSSPAANSPQGLTCFFTQLSWRRGRFGNCHCFLGDCCDL